MTTFAVCVTMKAEKRSITIDQKEEQMEHIQIYESELRLMELI